MQTLPFLNKFVQKARHQEFVSQIKRIIQIKRIFLENRVQWVFGWAFEGKRSDPSLTRMLWACIEQERPHKGKRFAMWFKRENERFEHIHWIRKELIQLRIFWLFPWKTYKRYRSLRKKCYLIYLPIFYLVLSIKKRKNTLNQYL